MFFLLFFLSVLHLFPDPIAPNHEEPLDHDQNKQGAHQVQSGENLNVSQFGTAIS